MRLYLERPANRIGAVTQGDEEECYTANGRRTGIWLTSALVAGPNVLSADIDSDTVAPYEVTNPGDEHRTFVVPALVAAAQDFA